MWTGLWLWVSGKAGWVWGLIPVQFRIWVTIGVAVVALASAGYAGWTLRTWKADASEKQLLAAQVEALQAYEKISREFVIAYNAKRNGARIVYKTITKEIDNVTTGRLCLDPAAVRLWNNALDGVPPPSGGAADNAGGAGEAGASDKEVTSNATTNFEKWQACRTQLKALIEWHKATDSK